MPDTMPSVDDLFPPQQAKSVDELFPPQIEQDRLHKTNASGSFMDFVFGDTMASHVGRVMDAFGQGAAQGWGTGAGAGPTSDGLGLSDDAINWLRKAGIFNDYAKGQYDIGKTINEAVIRPAAWGLDAFLHGTSALFGGVQAATQEAVAEITGSEQLGRDIAAMPEAFMGSPHPTGVPKAVAEAKPQITVMLPGQPGFIESRVEPKFDINQARDLKVIGSGEAGFNGTAEPAPSATAEAVKAAPEAVEAPTEPPPAPDVHTLARQIAPDVFKEFDALQQRKDVFRRWISELSDTRDAQVAAQAPHAAEIADLQERIADPATTKRLAKKYQTRLDQLAEEHDAYIEAHTQGDSPDMAKIRQRLMQTDFAMRDLAPQVGQAYRAAEEQMPKAAEAAPQETAPTQAVQEPEQPTAAAEAQPPELPEVAAEPELPAPPPAVKANPQVTPVADVKHISQDVAQKLIAAGRPAEEAQAAGKLVASHYWARAARFNGAKGTGLDLYNAEAPEIRLGRSRQRRVVEMAQSTTRAGKIKVAENARNTITLFKDADASTFIHETGHQWLEELMSDAADPAAPADLVKDAQTVRDWLRVKEGEAIPRKAHEQFARGFETYMMEGRAPSKGLAWVFEQFRQWLTAIYQTVAKLKSPINNDIRDVFDRLIAQKPERTVIAPERADAKGFADLHEADAETTPPPQADVVGDTVRSERDTVAAEELPEKQDARLEGVTDQARRREAGGAQSNGDRNVAGPATREASAGEATGTLGTGGSETPAEGAPTRAKPGRQSKSPESAHGVLEPEPETPAIDKAGNIRLDLLNTPEDVNAVIRETAKQNGDFIEARRGVVSDAQILDLADALGMDASTLSRRQIGQAFNAEQIVAARKLLIDSATKVRDLMAKAASGTDADVMAYAEAKQRHLMIQEQVAGITAEAGRALRAFRSIQGIKDAKELGAFLKDNTGRDLFQLRREAQLGLNLETPAQVSKFVHDSAKPTLADMALEVWINSLLSGPLTHATNIVSNALVALYRVPETAVASLLGSGRAALGFDGERVMAGEIGDTLFGIIQGAQEGVKAGYELFKNEGLLDEGNKIEQRRFQAIPSRRVNVFGREMELGGRQVRIPGRLLSAEDQVFKSIAYRQTLNALARRAAIKEGAQGDQLAARIAEIVKNPTEAMMQEASASADYQTFTTKLGKVGMAVQLFANSNPLIKLVVPFIRTPVNIVKFAGERSPFGLFMRDVRENLSGAKGPVARDTQIARIALGTSLSITAAYLASQGLLTGGGPADPKQRALLYATGWQPYSVKIGDAYYSFSRLEPLGTLLGVAADMYEISHASTDAENAEIAKLIFGSVSKNLTSKTWLRGPSELLQAINDPDRYGRRYVHGLVGTVVPTGVAQVARVNDPYLRDARTMIDTIKSRIPGLSESLLPRRDIWGQPIRLEGSLGPDLLSPIYQSRINNDPVNRALLDLHMYPSNPQRRVRGVTLTDAEYDDLVRIGGHAAKARLDALVRVPGFRAAPPEIQRNAIKAIIDSARETARGYVMMRYPHIIHDAIRLKTDPLHKKH